MIHITKDERLTLCGLTNQRLQTDIPMKAARKLPHTKDKEAHCHSCFTILFDADLVKNIKALSASIYQRAKGQFLPGNEIDRIIDLLGDTSDELKPKGEEKGSLELSLQHGLFEAVRDFLISWN